MNLLIFFLAFLAATSSATSTSVAGLKLFFPPTENPTNFEGFDCTYRTETQSLVCNGIKCNAVYEQSKTGPRLSQVRSFGILRSSSRTASSSVSVTKAENPTYNLYVKKLEGMKITLDPSTHLFFSSSKSSSLLSGLRVIELGCFQELARMLNSSASAHKVMTLDESRLKIVTIYGEIKLVNPSQVAEERVKRELVGDSLMKKFEQVKNWFSDKSNALLGSALVSTLIPKTDN